MSSGEWSEDATPEAVAGNQFGTRALSLAALVLIGVAYRDLLVLDFRAGAMALESWFIRPTGLPFPLALGGGLWLVWRRRAQWRRLSEDGSGHWLATFALFVSATLLVWGRLTGVLDLHVQSLAALALGFAALRKGRAGARLVALPALFLLLALSPSPAAVNEIFWFIQVHTAWAAAAVVDGFGMPILLETIILTTPDAVFAVIESCASLGVMVILLALAVLLREPITGLGIRSWLIVLGAVPLAIALNLLRVVTIIVDPRMNSWSHLVQWGVLIGFGVLVLAAVARALARRAGSREGAPASVRSSPTSPGLPRPALLVLLVWVFLSLPSRPTPLASAVEPSLETIPLEWAGWSAETVTVDHQFLGWVRFREAITRFYSRGSDVVQLFVGVDDSRARTASPFSPKTLLHGFGWIEVEGDRSQLLGGASPPETTIVALETERWWVAQWRVGYHGVVGEALRHAFALDASPFAAPRTRAVVRLSVLLPNDDAETRAEAARIVEDFLRDFEPYLPLPSRDGSEASPSLR